MSSLYAKVAELRNSLTHLAKSNQELEPYAWGQNGDKDCADAIKENEEVMDRMRHRILLIEYEVEVTRGMKWDPEAIDQKEPGETESTESSNTATTSATNGTTTRTQNGSLSDEELRRRMEERMNMQEHGDNNASDGVHL